MAIVKRANVVLEVKDDAVQRYLDNGYSEIDSKGQVINSPAPTDPGVLRQLYIENTKKIEELEAQIVSLTDELKKAKGSAKKVTKAED